MSHTESETKFARLPEQIRHRVDDQLQHSAIGLKLMVGQALTDREELNAHAVSPAGRTGLKSGQVSELTVIADLKPDGAHRLRKMFKLIDGNFAGATEIGTLHDMRFVFLDNDTKLLFATAYDGEWDPYIDDFGTLIPELMDYIFDNVEGWPGIHSPDVKDFIASLQISAAGWYVAHPELTVAEGTRLLEQDKNVNAFVQTLN